VNPADDNNQALIRASVFKREEVIRLLLADPRVDPEAVKRKENRTTLKGKEPDKTRTTSP